MLNRSLLILIFILVSGKLVEAKEKMYLIAHAGAGDPFWNVEFKGAKQAAHDLGVDLQILAPEKPNDIARQVQILQAAIATRPDGIALSIADDLAFSSSLKEARNKGIEVVAFNSRPSEKYVSENPYSAFVGMDEFQAGVMAAERAVRTGRIKKRVVVAVHQAGHIGMEKRYAGIKSVMDKVGVLTDKLDTGSDASRAQIIFRSYMKKNPDLTGVFCVGPAGLHPVARLLEKEKKSLFLASFDLTPLTLRYVGTGLVDFTIDQQPYMQGYLSVVQLALAARNKLTPASVDTGVGVVDQSNADTVRALVSKGIR